MKSVHGSLTKVLFLVRSIVCGCWIIVLQSVGDWWGIGKTGGCDEIASHAGDKTNSRDSPQTPLPASGLIRSWLDDVRLVAGSVIARNGFFGNVVDDGELDFVELGFDILLEFAFKGAELEIEEVGGG